MRKKKNPEQEEQPGTEEREVDTPTEEPTELEQPQEEPAQDQEPEDREEPEAEEPAQDQEPQDQQEDLPEAPAPAEPRADEVATLRRQLMEAQGRNAAYAAGVAPSMVDDAVTLAMAEAAKAGEVTEAAVTKAVEAVLKRHPEWKAAEAGKQKGGFKMGADRDSGGTVKKPVSNTTQNLKRWNRFK